MIIRIADWMYRVGRKEEKGLTLIELMIVLAIVAIIAALAIPQIMGWLTAAEEEAAEADANSLTSAIQMYALQDDEVHSPSAFWAETDDDTDLADEDMLGEYTDINEIEARYDDVTDTERDTFFED